MDITNFLATIGVSFGTSLATTTGSQILSGPISTLNDWWYVKFGHKTAEEKALMVAKQEANAEKLKMEILKNVQQIPDQNLQEPSISILGPAIEASRFYINDDEIRTMFAKLISASLDDRKNKFLHHAFVEIIKQMSPQDAKLIELFKIKPSFPVTSVTIKNGKGMERLIDLLFLENDDDYESNAISLTNLQRLGLININLEAYLTSEGLYNKYSESLQLQDLKLNNFVEQKRKHYQTRVDYLGREEVMRVHNLTSEKLDELLIHHEPELVKGLVDITPLGKAFLKVCY